MPFSRIALPVGTTSDFRTGLSEILHRTLVDFFDVPPDDCFQLLDEYAPEQRVFPRHYLGGPRSEGFIWFHITAGRPRSVEQKQQFYHHLAHRLSSELAVRPEDVMVTLSFTQPEDWSFACGNAFHWPAENTL
ncbi:MAG TPA: tautomerase family protein [Erwinia persicina]|nr:tautomerase family protein [Erwinia persicina]HBH69322.1 tautomerase family protein [Erwinia persicina]HBI06363.1 tautomerase family protein [Erwinia persicina]HBT51867.1 tautomerase family protein [Erwinia persicina]